MSIKKFIIQSLIIIFLSLSLRLIYNQIVKKPLPIFKAYKKENNNIYFHVIDAEVLKNLLENDMLVLILRDILMLIPGLVIIFFYKSKKLLYNRKL